MNYSKPLNLAQLRDEARTAGTLGASEELGCTDTEIHTYDTNGNIAELDPSFEATLNAHIALREETHEELVEKYNTVLRIPGSVEERLTIIEQILFLTPRDQKVKE